MKLIKVSGIPGDMNVKDGASIYTGIGQAFEFTISVYSRMPPCYTFKSKRLTGRVANSFSHKMRECFDKNELDKFVNMIKEELP